MPSSFDRLVNWGERYLKTDLRYLAAGGFWLTLGQFSLALIAFGLSVLFARLVSKDVYGTYRFLQSVFWTLTAFSLTGIPIALARSVAKGFEGAYKKAMRLSLVWSFPMVFFALGAGTYYFLHGNALLGYGCVVIAIAGPLFQPSLLFNGFFEGKREFRWSTACTVGTNLFAALCTLITMLLCPTPLALLIAFLAGNIIGGLTCAAILFARFRPNDLSPENLASLGGHFSVMNFLDTIAQQADKLVVFHYLGAADLAVYSFAIAVPEHLKNMLNSVATVAFPKFAERSIQQIDRNLWRRLWLFTGALALVALAYIAVAPLAFDILFPKYIESARYSQIFALALVFVAGSIPIALLQAQAANRELYVLSIVSPIVQIGALVVCTAFWGLLGTIAARILTRAFGFLLGITLVRARTRSA